MKALAEQRKASEVPSESGCVYDDLKERVYAPGAATTRIGSAIFANKPGDGSAREQAASCQRVLGGAANFACEYATKRYRSNCINWGMLPFTYPDDNINLEVGEYVYLPGIRKAVEDGATRFEATIIGKDGSTRTMELQLNGVTEAEKKVLLAGSLINSYTAE